MGIVNKISIALLWLIFATAVSFVLLVIVITGIPILFFVSFLIELWKITVGIVE